MLDQICEPTFKPALVRARADNDTTSPVFGLLCLGSTLELVFRTIAQTSWSSRGSLLQLRAWIMIILLTATTMGISAVVSQ